MEYIVRNADPADAGFLAWAMLESTRPVTGKGIFDEALSDTGTSAPDFHASLLLANANNWGQIDSALILEDAAGRKLGAMSAFDNRMKDLRPLTPDGFAIVADRLGWTQSVARQFWRKYISFFGLFGQSPQLSHAADYVIEYGAIVDDARGRGLYGHLLRAHCDRATRAAQTAISHSAVFGNEAVVRSLLRFGFKEVKRLSPESYNHKFPGMIRLRYEL